MQVWQLQEPFPNDYYLVWTLVQIQKIYSIDRNEKSHFFELWRQHKQLKTMKMSEAWPDIYNEEYIYQFQPETTLKIH